MSTRTKHIERDVFYFITFTCYKWLNLIDYTHLYDYFPYWVTKLNEKGVVLNGYVLMPNHIHLLVFVNENANDLNMVFAEGKRFMAYEIVKRLTKFQKLGLLNTLKKGVTAKEKRQGKKHQIFVPSFDAKICRGDDQICKVLDYIHHNPVQGKWKLADDYLSYPWSSANFYERNILNEVSLVDYRNVFD